jgi:peptidoglycan hydrolase-like protein with peptidoglycan-binding domain
MKKFSLYLIPVLIVTCFVILGSNTKAEAQSVFVCPVGYVCTPSTFVCPVGYTCVPNNVSTQNICPEGYICTQTNIPRKENSCAIFNVNMGLDSVGESVTSLQKFLDSKGLYNWDVYGASSRDGVYDEATAQSVMEYQASQGLPTTGFVGPLTRGKINAELCGNSVANNVAKQTPTPSYTPTPVPATKIQPVVKSVVTQTPTPVYTPTPVSTVNYQPAVTSTPIIPAKKTTSITVLTPVNSKNSSTIFSPGEKLNINWSSTEIGINKIVLESYDGLTVSVYQNPAYTAPYQRTDYSWTVPANIATGYYKIKVYSADAQSYGESSYFRIANNDIPLVNSTAKSSTSYGVNTPVLTVLTPMSQVTGGTYFQVGEKMVIQWSLSTAQEVRRIQLIPVNGGQKIDILDYTRPDISPAVMYSYVWTVPKTVPYARYFVYVQIGPDESISASGKSAQMVTIINPELIPTPTVTATPVPSSSPTGKTGKDSLSASVLDAVQGLFR